MTTKAAKNFHVTLKTFLFNSPIKFALITGGIILAFGLFYSFISSLLTIHVAWPLFIIITAATGIVAYKMLSRLPNISMNQHDFIKIVNGQALISLCVMLFSVLIISNGANSIRNFLLWLLSSHPVAFWILSSVSVLIYLYVLGTILVCIYAKYKRALTFGIPHWKIICSMPFAFLLMWTPGYLIEEKNQKEEINIQSNLYQTIHKYVIANKSNTIFSFIVLLCITKLLSGFVPLLATLGLLVLYALWNLKYKNTFMNKISKEYSLMAALINLAILIAILVVKIF